MPHITTDDGVRLYCEETGEGRAIVFVHEFAGDHRSWEPQVRFFSRRYRCITFAARGYPPSGVPEELECYSQARARDDIRDVMRAHGLGKAHVVGLSMGGFATLHFGMEYPAMCESIVVAGCGYGAEPDRRAQFQEEARAVAAAIRREGMDRFAAGYAAGPARVQFEAKDPRGYDEFRRQLAEHSAAGSANTQLGCQARRPSLYDLTDRMRAMRMPVLVVTGDEDDPCLLPGVLMKRSIPGAGLAVIPKSGHTINLEEPARFNAELADFFHQVESGRWGLRDPRSQVESITGAAAQTR